jgi:tetratricopeptide (TPR) repeat protein
VDRSKGFFTETAAMRTLSFPSSSQVDWSFRIGLGLVALFAAIEILSAGYYYAGRIRGAPPAVAVTAPTPAKVMPTVAPTAAPVTAPSVAAVTAATPSTATLSVADRLLKEATALRERGDTTTALARLQEAAQRDPKNAQVLAEMATIYESIQLYDRSNESWHKIEEIGPSAGALYDLAETKLKLGAAAPTLANAAPAVTPAAPPVPPPAESTSSTTTSTSTQTAATAHTGAEGIADGAVLGISDVSVTETPDNDAESNLLLRISIKARPGTVIDHTKVTIRVYFYDTVGDDPKPVLTDAQTNFEWVTPNHDWVTTNPEILAVTYFRPKNQAASSEAALSAAAAQVVPGKKPRPTSAKLSTGTAGEAGLRHYLGYIVRIYYNDKLQAQRAQPSKLLAIFPSPSSSP